MQNLDGHCQDRLKIRTVKKNEIQWKQFLYGIVLALNFDNTKYHNNFDHKDSINNLNKLNYLRGYSDKAGQETYCTI